jgi:hypothetical protein
MSTNAGTVTDPTLQKLVDGLIASIQLPDGSYPDAAPNAWKDSQGKNIPAIDTDEFEIVLRVLPDGQSASASIRPLGSRARAIAGPIDNSVLATKLV